MNLDQLMTDLEQAGMLDPHETQITDDVERLAQHIMRVPTIEDRRRLLIHAELANGGVWAQKVKNRVKELWPVSQDARQRKDGDNG